MPLVRIDLAAGRAPGAARDIADAVHQALVDAFHIPVADRFHVLPSAPPRPASQFMTGELPIPVMAASAG